MNDSYNVNEDQTLTLANGATDVFGNDTDADGNNLTAALVGSSSHGTVSLNADGSFTYTPNPNYNGPDAFKFRVCDDSTPTPLCDTGDVEILVTPVNDAPVANNDSYTGDEGQTLSVDAPGLLANDSDEETPRSGLEVCEIRVQRGGSTATASGTNITIQNDEGRLISDGTGHFTFNPTDPDYFGTFTFEYVAASVAASLTGTPPPTLKSPSGTTTARSPPTASGS